MKISKPGEVQSNRPTRAKLKSDAIATLVEMTLAATEEKTQVVASKAVLSYLAEEKRAKMAKAKMRADQLYKAKRLEASIEIAKAKQAAAEAKLKAKAEAPGKKDQIVIDAQRITETTSKFARPTPPTFSRTSQ